MRGIKWIASILWVHHHCKEGQASNMNHHMITISENAPQMEAIPQRGIKYCLLILTITITIVKSSIASLLYTIYNYMLYTVHYYYYKEEEFLPGLLPFPLCIIARKQLFTRKDINQIGT